MRNPLLLFRLPVVFLLRLAARMFLGLLFQEPPRRTRRERGDGQASACGRLSPITEVGSQGGVEHSVLEYRLA